MRRIINMQGRKGLYREIFPKNGPDDGREINMNCEENTYIETTGVESIERQMVVGRMQIVATEDTAGQVVGPLPECLATEQAMVYWQRLVAAGFVDENYQLLPTTSRRQACYIANEFARKMDVEHVKWKLFQDLWGKKNLAQDWSQVQFKKLLKDETWHTPRHDEIDDIFDQPV